MIETAFNAPVYDQYGCGEVSWLAAQCSHRQGLHIFADARHVECVDDTGKTCDAKQLGAIAVTDLENFVFPFIRYVDGDQGALLDETCSCGINLPLMDAVKGRLTDMVYLRDGTTVSGDYLTTIFDNCPDVVRAFQVVQQANSSLVVRVVPNLQCKNPSVKLDEVRRTLLERVRHQTSVTIEVVKQIPQDRGKTNVVISEIARHEQRS